MWEFERSREKDKESEGGCQLTAVQEGHDNESKDCIGNTENSLNTNRNYLIATGRCFILNFLVLVSIVFFLFSSCLSRFPESKNGVILP